MISRALGLWVILVGSVSAGCSLVLDYDSLQKGESSGGADTEQPTDTAAPPKPCSSDPECDDSIPCTADRCGDDNYCVNDPDDSQCGEFERCDSSLGCVASGRECNFDGDCADPHDCTVDFCRDDGTCGHVTHDERCADADLCMTDMVCDPVLGCTGGYEVVCDQPDGPTCYNFFCNPSNGFCDRTELKPGADKDGDGYCHDLAIYGGDDCDDESPSINPGAAEVCNLLDDNCDGVIDGVATAGPVQIIDADTISSPAAAYSNGRYSLVWQTGTGNQAAVYLQALGSGACLLDPVCDGTGNAIPASEALNFTAMGGDNTAGTEPAISARENQLVVVWIARPTGENPKAVSLEVPLGESGLDIGNAITTVLSAGDAVALARPRVDWTGGADWVAAWHATFADGTHAVQVAHRGAGGPFTGDRETAALDGLDIACRSADQCLVAYGQEVGGDVELFEARLQLLGGVWSYLDGWPKMVSEASDNSGDLSTDPAIAWSGDDSWVISFTDVAEPRGGNGMESDSDIRAVVNGGVVSAVEDLDANQVNGGLVFDGSHFGLLHTHVAASGVTLIHRVFDASFAILEDRRSLISTIPAGTIEPSMMITADSGDAFAWVESPTGGRSTLRFVSFRTCQ